MIQTHTIIDGFSSINLAEDVVASSTLDRIVTIGPIGKDYTSIALALAGEADFQTGEDNIVFIIDAGQYGHFGISSSSVFTTSASHKLKFQCATGVSHSLARSTGVRIVSGSNYMSCIDIYKPYCVIDGIGVSNPMPNGAYGIAIRNGANNCEIKNCLAYDCNSHGYYLLYGGQNNKFINCVSENCNSGFCNRSGNTAYYYNCEAINCNTYGFFTASWTTSIIKNSYAGGSTTADFYGEANSTTTMTTCRSSDGTLSTSTVSLANCGFTNSTAGSEDVSISASSDFIDVGTDLSGDSAYPFDTDVFGTARDANWDIGVMEYAAPGLTGSVSVSQKKQTLSASGWSGTTGESIVETSTIVDNTSNTIVTTSSINETSSLVDSQDIIIQTSSSIEESLTLTETQNSTIIGLSSSVETSTLVSYESNSCLLPVDIIETSAIIETTNNINIAISTIIEANTLNDVQENTYITNANISESTNIYDIEDVNGSNAAIITETTGTLDITNGSSLLVTTTTENSLSYDEITAVQNIQIDVIDYIQVIDNINATILHSINIEENSTTNDSSQSVIINVLTILFWNDLQLDFNNFPSSTDLKLNVRGKIVGIPIIAATDDRNGAIRIIIDSEVRALQQIII